MGIVDNIFKTELTQDEEDEQILYHYTTWEGLKGIIENRCFWLTDYRSLNDTSEIHYAIGYFGENIFEPAQEKERQHFYRAQEDMLSRYPYYIASMCKLPNYLPAWRSYSNDGAGFAIGFSRKKIKEAWYIPQRDAPQFEGIFHEAHYISRENTSDDQKEVFKRLNGLYKEIQGDEKLKAPLFYLFIRSYFPLIKHVCYQEEKEVRLSFSGFCYNLNEQVKIHYRPNGSKPLMCGSNPYIEKAIELDWIKEIWTGPRIHERHALQEIHKLLPSEHPKICHSKLPYKNPEKWRD